MLGVYLGVRPEPPREDHTCRRDWLLVAATWRRLEGPVQSQSQPAGCGGAEGGRQGMWGQGAGRRHRLAREQSQTADMRGEGLDGVQLGSAAEIEDTHQVGAPECGSGPQEETFPRDPALEATAKRP